MFDGFFGYLIGGAAIGVLARFIKPGADPLGWILTIALGVVGAVVGGHFVPGGGWLAWVVAIAAAIALLFVYEKVRRKKA